jgi:hypothetical protein
MPTVHEKQKAARYKEKLEDQGGRCAICTCDEFDNKRKLAQDHNHLTGRPRGLLCNRCNAGIGLFLERIELLEMAIRYLKRYEGCKHM